jgi:hypothetical protein
VARWNADWSWWRTTGSARAAVRRWAERIPSLADLATVDEVLAACGGDQRVGKELADQRLAAIVALARGGDREAARLALQRVFPGLIQRTMVRARMHQLVVDGLLEDLMTAAWLEIIDFPLQKRPVKIAVNIIRDAEYRLFGYVPLVEQQSVLMPPQELPQHPVPGTSINPAWAADPQEQLDPVPRMLLDAVEDGLPARDARLLVQLYIFDRSVAQVAAAEGTSQRWVRTRRERALKGLAAHLARQAADTAERSGNQSRGVRPGRSAGRGGEAE